MSVAGLAVKMAVTRRASEVHTASPGMSLARQITPAKSIRPIHGGVQRRPDLGVDHKVGQVIKVGWLPVDDHQGGPALQDI